WRRHPFDGPKLVAMMEELGFRGYANRVRGAMKATGQAKNAELLAAIGVESKGPPAQGELFAGAPEQDPDEFPFGANTPPAPKADGWKTDYQLIDTAKAWKDFLKQLKTQKRFAVDLATTGVAP